MAKANYPPFGRKLQDQNVHEWCGPVSDLDLRAIRDAERDKAAQEITKPGRDQHIKNAQLHRKTLAAALREVEKTTPLKAGLKYIGNKVRPNLPEHLPTDYPDSSNSTIKRS
jgi:hypothetical protein